MSLRKCTPSAVVGDDAQEESNKKIKTYNGWNDQWAEMFSGLVKYKAVYKHTNVPASFEEDQQLGTWVRNLRLRYRQKKLDPNRTKQLESIGFRWNLVQKGKKKIPFQTCWNVGRNSTITW